MVYRSTLVATIVWAAMLEITAGALRATVYIKVIHPADWAMDV